MKKSELKLLIKECVKEVIFEEGALRSIVTEVAQGLTAHPVVVESRSEPVKITPPNAARRAVLDSIGRDNHKSPVSERLEKARASFSNSALFEGTRPIQEEGAPSTSPGVDISNLPGIGSWGAVATTTK